MPPKKNYTAMTSALLTPREFDAHITEKTLRLSFVGMSNCGKSYRSRILQNENDFFWYQVDGDIQKTLGLHGQEAMSLWLGSPSSEHFSEREKRYLELENKFTEGAAMSSHGKNLVFDTTGSVVHLVPATHAALRENTLVVHLDVGEDSIEEMLRRFFKDPKPVAWSGFFTQRPDESESDAIRRSYPALLHERLKRYRALAHLNISAREVRDATGAETLAIIRNKL